MLEPLTETEVVLSSVFNAEASIDESVIVMV